METFTLGNLEKYKKIVELTTKAAERSHETERGELVRQLMDVLNMSRHGKFALLTFPRMGVLLEKIPTDALYTLLAKCKESGELARNKRKFATEEEKKKLNTYESAFSKKFYWELKVQKDAR